MNASRDISDKACATHPDARRIRHADGFSLR
jgi:hypothetical protein